MKRRILLISGIVLGVMACLFILAVPAAPFFVKLGVKPICIQGNFPQLRVVACPQNAHFSPAATPLPLPTLDNQGPIPVIVDDDGSPDGTIVLLYLLSNPLYEVKAVTVSSGEAHPDLFARQVTKLLASLGRSDIPVGYGSAKPLSGDNSFPEPWRQASDAFWEIKLPEAQDAIEARPAAQLIVDTLSSSTQPTNVFVSGTHTNIAEALRLDPSIKEHVRDIYIMGGSVYAPGNIESDWTAIHNKVAEWNIFVDPVAAGEVFASGLPLHIVPLDGTNQVAWTESDASSWASQAAPEGVLASDLLSWMLRLLVS